MFPSDDADSNELPFERLVDYASFVVYVRPARIATLQATLHAVAADRAGVLGYGGGSVLCGSIGLCWIGLT